MRVLYHSCRPGDSRGQLRGRGSKADVVPEKNGM